MKKSAQTAITYDTFKMRDLLVVNLAILTIHFMRKIAPTIKKYEC